MKKKSLTQVSVGSIVFVEMNLRLGNLFLHPVACVFSFVSQNQSTAAATLWMKLHLT